MDDTGLRIEDIPVAMSDRLGWREHIKWIRDLSTWWVYPICASHSIHVFVTGISFTPLVLFSITNHADTESADTFPFDVRGTDGQMRRRCRWPSTSRSALRSSLLPSTVQTVERSVRPVRGAVSRSVEGARSDRLGGGGLPAIGRREKRISCWDCRCWKTVSWLIHEMSCWHFAK